jgi:uncharacterized membrane protein YqaE (UPF0057 family)
MAFASLAPIMPIIPPIIIIGIVVIIFGDILYEVVINFPKILKLIMSLTDPEIFMRDLTYGIFTGIQLVIWSFMDVIKGILLKIASKIGITDDFFGLKVKNKNTEEDVHNKLNQFKCVKPTFIKYIILVICPPLYVFMNKGINGWMYIIIDIILTMLFYFPGLLYALLICNICGS